MVATTTRSWWGWGVQEQALDAEEVSALERRVATLAAGHDLTAHEPPTPSDELLPPVRVTPPGSLEALCTSDPRERAAHTHGKAFRDVVRNLRGDLRNAPDLVARPRSERDVVELLDWCSTAGLAAIPYGGGSSVVGGVEPRFDDDLAGAVSIDLTGMDQVLEVDRTSRAARIQAGVLGPSLEAQLRPYDLTLRHFPQSFEFSSLGGWLATRAGGHFATVRTHIDDFTQAMRVVTPTGVVQSRRLPGSGAGPSPDRLFLGSEGALGVVTEAWMRLQRRPTHRAGASVRFTDFDRAVAAVREIAQSWLDPANCRLLDAAEAYLNAGTSVSGGVLVLGFESADHPVDDALRRAVEIGLAHGGTHAPPDVAAGAGSRDAPADAWRTAFLRMPYLRDALAQRSVIAETFETATTWQAFPALHAAVTLAATEALRSICGAGVVTCRFTHVYPDGPAPYYGVYAPGRWDGLVAQWDEIKAAVSEAILTHGGTITHHHAVGRDHRPWYDRQRPDPYAAALRGAKSALDPAGVLNPGVLVDRA
ncbi:alkyldihydroxyacetonephosphate synthase [Mumia flava]|uniref:Alkyldihydroxyacetonephosphate synthase n=1 Tax=Mumia flava TaxID=1348852 RepID=A0A0B2BFT2_9ACTN|nr:FAD-binding oxidoreductase [Mumia flava]PJJ56824.1 alkyldihydroxyacetonephosphate synthase [Mumia flava]